MRWPLQPPATSAAEAQSTIPASREVEKGKRCKEWLWLLMSLPEGGSYSLRLQVNKNHCMNLEGVFKWPVQYFLGYSTASRARLLFHYPFWGTWWGFLLLGFIIQAGFNTYFPPQLILASVLRSPLSRVNGAQWSGLLTGWHQKWWQEKHTAPKWTSGHLGSWQ